MYRNYFACKRSFRGTCRVRFKLTRIRDTLDFPWMSRFVPCRKSLCSRYMHRVPPNGPMRRDVRNNPDVRSFSLSLSLFLFFSLVFARLPFLLFLSHVPALYKNRLRLAVNLPTSSSSHSNVAVSPFPRARPFGALGMHRRGRRNAIDSVILSSGIERIALPACCSRRFIFAGEFLQQGFTTVYLRSLRSKRLLQKKCSVD